MKKSFLILLAFVFLFFADKTCAFDLPFVPKGGYSNILQYTPPSIISVSISSNLPQEEMPVEVSAVIFNNPKETDDFTTSAILHYSLDKGKSWQEVEMEQDDDDENLWRATIPGQPRGAYVLYYLSALDTSNNIASETPGGEVPWPLTEGKGLVKVVDDPDDKGKVVADDLDIREAYIGYDGENIYIKWEVEGAFTAGTLTPTYAHIYALVMLNLDKEVERIIEKLREGGSAEEAVKSLSKKEIEHSLKKIYAFVYAPHAQIANYPSVALIHLEGGRPIIDTEGFSYELSEHSLCLKINCSSLGRNLSGLLRVVFATGVVTSIDISSPAGMVADVSNFVNFYLRYHDYVVK